MTSFKGRLKRCDLKKRTQFSNGRNDVKYLYERWLWSISCFEAAKKQSQFKANQTQYYLAPRIFWGLKTNLKKRTQFSNGQNELKYLYERGLWRILRFGAAKKQSQTKPIYSYCVLRTAYCEKESGRTLWCYLVGAEGSLFFGEVFVLDGAVGGIY